jgi:hypothetical protein
MGLAEIFGFATDLVTVSTELPDIFPFPVSQTDFVRTDVSTIYSKILTDVLERIHGLSDDQLTLMWDNCLKSSSLDGLITLLAKAMAAKNDLFLVYDKAVNVVRRATSAEQMQIRADYEKQASSPTGVYISFKNYDRTDMVRLYSGLEYCTVAALSKSMNLSKAIQLKFKDLREGISLSDSAAAKTQGRNIADALKMGRDVMLDAADEVTCAMPNLEPVQASMTFIIKKLSFYLGLPEAYLSGEQTGGLGTTGENDTKAIERGLKNYYFAIMKPTLESLFDVKLSYKTQDFRQIEGSMEVLKTFTLVDETLISQDNKRKIINSLLDLPEDAEGDPVQPHVAAAVTGFPGSAAPVRAVPAGIE